MERADRDLAEAVLRASPWLKDGREGLVEPLLRHGRIVRLAPGQWAHAEGDDEAGVIVVLAGTTDILCKAPGDREVLFGLAGPGAALGQTMRFGGGPRLVTVICREPCVLLDISDRALARIAVEVPAIWEAVAALLYLQLRSLVHRVVEATALPPRQRLAARLELLARMASAAELAVSQEGLGEMVGLTRKTVNAHLGDFERAGLIRRAYGRIVLLDRPGLRRLVET
ncbi:Crp/Fnr family transcriptional regulator [Phenylobacterium sp.]|uniref:Crp/Fnr family transcriptional regulator n=1 Tax=Phenylobacterium sp. TaxID=1871053 RepID=UPI0025DF88BC|nr:Crp/Fnr family transcriptional regulator [Phenylobacterium sp.]